MIRSTSILAWLTRRLRVACWLWFAAGAAGSVHAAPLVLDDRPEIQAWPAVTVLSDPDDSYTVQQLAAQPQRFETPTGTPGNLGRRDATMWLRIPVLVPGVETVRRVFQIDYPSLNRVELYVVREGVVLSRTVMGNELRRSERPLQARTHAAPLTLEPGEYQLLVRVQTLSSMVIPITLLTPEAFTEHESRVQILQGMIGGLALCMLLYSLLHWVNLRDPVFLQYALLLAGNMVFTLAYFGIGAQYLWPDWPELSMRVAPMGIMVAVAAGATFMRSTLAVDEISPFTGRVLRVANVAALVGLAAMLFGLLGYRSAQSLVTVLGLVVTLAVLPVAFVRSRRGEPVAMIMLFGWAFYMIGALTTAGLLRGYVEPTIWTQHLYPFSTMIEMTAWMAVLGLRVQTIHRRADRARVEADTLRTLAHTDALTGLPNRRGLQGFLARALQRCNPNQILAVYLLDLDGFKSVNDRWGHDVGDALLVEVGKRLEAQLRGGDVVARLGGDEFVVLAGGLADEAAAHGLGQKLLSAFNAPFDAAGQTCEVGLTVGFALAPHDGVCADELIKRADAAMYAGKQSGRRRVQRGGRSLAAA